MSSEQSRKVLEDIQRAKSKLLKDGAAASLGISTYAPTTSPTIPPAGTQPSFSNDVHLSPAQRSAMQVLQQANTISFGYFVTQDSHFGNSILPVLPRLDPLSSTSTAQSLATPPISTSTPPTTALPASVKTEK